MNCLSVFDHYVGLALNGLIPIKRNIQHVNPFHARPIHVIYNN